PAPAARQVELGTYCVGSPMDTPHRLAQLTAQPGKTGDWRLRLGPGRYTIRSPQSRAIARSNVTGDNVAGSAGLAYAAILVRHDPFAAESRDRTDQRYR